MTHNQVPSFCRRAISAVTMPSGRRVEVRAKSPQTIASRCSPIWNFRPIATSSLKNLRIASWPCRSRPAPSSSTASGSYKAVIPSTSPMFCLETNSGSKSWGSYATPPFACSLMQQTPFYARPRLDLTEPSSSPGSLEKVIPEATYLRLGVDQSALLIKLEKRPFLESSAHDGLAAGQYELPRPTIFIELEPWTSLNWDAVDVQILRKSNAVEVPFHEVDVRPPRKFPTDDDMLSRKGGS